MTCALCVARASVAAFSESALLGTGPSEPSSHRCHADCRSRGTVSDEAIFAVVAKHDLTVVCKTPHDLQNFLLLCFHVGDPYRTFCLQVIAQELGGTLRHVRE